MKTSTPPTHRAAPPRPPNPNRRLASAQSEHSAKLSERLALERRSILRGLLLLAILILVISGVRAGFDRMFTTHWWRQW